MSLRTALAIFTLLVTATALAGCTGGVASPSGDAVSADGTRTITYLIGQPDVPEHVDLLKKQIDEFEAQAKDIEVKLDVLPNDQLRTVLQTQLRSGNGPDVFGYDTGPGFAGVLADAGLLYDLTEAYAKNDWKIYDWAKERVTFDGKVLGVPGQVETLGIFYNKDLFAQHGIAEPKSLSDLEAAAAKLKAAGIIPFAFGDQEGWQGGHVLSMSLASRVGSQGMTDLIEGRTPWSSPEVVAAISTFFDEYNDKGYLPESAAAISYDNANALFYSGKAAMNPTGTWLVSDIITSTNFDVGYIPFPGPDSPGIYAGGLGGGTFVSANTEVPEAAIQFLDWMQSQEHGAWNVAEMHSIPAFPVDLSGVEAGPLFEQVLEQTSKISEGSGDFGLNIDVLTSNQFNEAMSAGLQSVLTGQKSPQQVADSLQAAFEQSDGP
jgi:raffinose/stachyose/melibiose transport system substrate-binding protein